MELISPTFNCTPGTHELKDGIPLDLLDPEPRPGTANVCDAGSRHDLPMICAVTSTRARGFFLGSVISLLLLLPVAPHWWLLPHLRRASRSRIRCSTSCPCEP
jgi:hypothetical protein